MRTSRVYVFDFKLEVELFEVDEIEIVEDTPRRWRRQLKQFEKAFLGTSENARACTLLNPEYLSFTSEKRGQLEASASAPLIIENRALGYRIEYLLDAFSQTRSQVEFQGHSSVFRVATIKP